MRFSIGARLAASLLALLAALASLIAPGPAAAHALLRASEPAAGAALGTSPSAVTLTFSEAPDIALTAIKVLDTGGTEHATGPAVAVAGKPQQAAAPIGELADGVYTVSWRTVSAVDGHVSAGSFVFGVGVAPPPTASCKAGQKRTSLFPSGIDGHDDVERRPGA